MTERGMTATTRRLLGLAMAISLVAAACGGGATSAPTVAPTVAPTEVGATETRYYARHALNGAAPDATLSAMLANGAHPDWLVPVELAGSPLRLYRVIR